MTVPLPMHAEHILDRTPRGAAELVHPCLNLSPLERKLLALVNGYTSLQAWSGQLGGARLELVARRLLSLGLVHTVHSDATLIPAHVARRAARLHVHPWAVQHP